MHARQNKYGEELEGFRKLAARLQQEHARSASTSAELAAAIAAAEALLADTRATAVAVLSGGGGRAKLAAKQLRLQRNQAFEAAKASLLEVAAAPAAAE